MNSLAPSRGNYTTPDFYTFDFQYNVEIPLSKKVKLFSYLSINNVFNQIRVTNFGRSSGSTIHTYPFSATDPGYVAASWANYGAANGSGSFGSTGSGAQIGGARSWNIDVGFKF